MSSGVAIGAGKVSGLVLKKNLVRHTFKGVYKDIIIVYNKILNTCALPPSRGLLVRQWWWSQ